MDIGALTGNATSGEAGRRSLSENFDTFLNLLTTQLQNQDPTSPMETEAFTNQIVQFSALEQQIAQSDKLEELLAAERTSQAAAAVGYLGKTIETKLSATQLSAGNAPISYGLPAGVDEVTVTVFDSDGSVVATLDGTTDEGLNEITWDGKNGQGIDNPDGIYTLLAVAKDADGNPLPANEVPVFFKGVAEEVLTESGETFVVVGGVPVAISDVLGVSDT